MQRLILLFFLCFFAGVTVSAQKSVVKDFIKKHRKGEENFAVKVPGWMIGLAGEIGILASEEEEERLIFELAQEFGTTRFLMFDTDAFDTSRDIKKLLRELEGGYGYERWAMVRGPEGEEVQLSVLYDGKEIRELVVFISDPDEMKTYFAHSKTDLTAEELGEVLNELMASN
ncbi:DUF4252 domain-containing protein [Lewinella sp. W8]|uniref:DUF4252 domain-containing protein n=1 Tax=Lewinella sp. W8 TaxID=2528208 RepID=UPI0010678706|nr:DUF4252 domain-containing protein [Lewinella sp. W8]MTB53632.1 DUF4252 domain-containing protein [Lewinella sp. W8]